eukprot:CAMPEP_0196748376 /NCGR_PEP_ID=MMETSP1091-20130531/73199_1 /TAXON_ID=302021 /ORGANISM="Rhodomonas sp., Strain CCMP768" /LENGTH=112 /DNA_ID=CAMNT_0042095689 /DNA_START=127 /DNA_END=465 /DNA_ORIENTATION=-
MISSRGCCRGFRVERGRPVPSTTRYKVVWRRFVDSGGAHACPFPRALVQNLRPVTVFKRQLSIRLAYDLGAHGVDKQVTAGSAEEHELLLERRVGLRAPISPPNPTALPKSA